MTLQEAISIIRNQSDKEIRKVKLGLASREAMRISMKKDHKEADSPRAQWLSNTADMVILFLRDEARKYNRKHKHERLSVLDLGDAIATAKARLGLTAETAETIDTKPTKTS
jgi:hypothetical protein